MEKKAINMPDGKGGWFRVEAQVGKGASVDKSRQSAIIEDEKTSNTLKLTETIVKLAFSIAKQDGLDKENIAYAMALACINIREDYPDGVGRFDEIASAAASYYDENTPKSI